MSNFCEVVGAELCNDKNGRDYKRVTLGTAATATTYVNPVTGEIHPVLAPSKTVRTIGYKVPYLFDEDDTNAVPDYLWNAAVGMVIEGEILRREVMPYDIDGESRTFATCFVQGNPNAADFQTAVKIAFERSGRTLVEDAVQLPTEDTLAATARGIASGIGV